MTTHEFFTAEMSEINEEIEYVRKFQDCKAIQGEFAAYVLARLNDEEIAHRAIQLMYCFDNYKHCMITVIAILKSKCTHYIYRISASHFVALRDYDCSGIDLLQVYRECTDNEDVLVHAICKYLDQRSFDETIAISEIEFIADLLTLVQVVSSSDRAFILHCSVASLLQSHESAFFTLKSRLSTPVSLAFFYLGALKAGIARPDDVLEHFPTDNSLNLLLRLPFVLELLKI